jgi:hypothetical protein
MPLLQLRQPLGLEQAPELVQVRVQAGTASMCLPRSLFHFVCSLSAYGPGANDAIRKSSSKVVSARTNFISASTVAATLAVRQAEVVEGFVGLTLTSCLANIAIKDVVTAVGIIGAATQSGLQLAAAIGKTTADKVCVCVRRTNCAHIACVGDRGVIKAVLLPTPVSRARLALGCFHLPLLDPRCRRVPPWLPWRPETA